MEYVSRVPRPPLDRLVDDLYYLEGVPPYANLVLPPMPAAVLIFNLGAPFRIETKEYVDGCAITMGMSGKPSSTPKQVICLVLISMHPMPDRLAIHNLLPMMISATILLSGNPLRMV